MNWKVGDRGEIFGVPPRENGGKLNGERVTVTGWAEYDMKYGAAVTVAENLMGQYGAVRKVEICCLRPIYDGNEKTSWEDCIWQPEELVRVG